MGCKMTKQDKMIAGVNIDKGELCYLKNGLVYPCQPFDTQLTKLYKVEIDEEGLRKIILNLKAIQFACLSSAQKDTCNAVITMDVETQENLAEAIDILEKL